MTIKPIVERKPDNNATSESRKGPNVTNGPIKKYPCAKPISIQRNKGVKPNRYAGKFCKIARVAADDVIGVAKWPTNGSSLYGLIKLAIKIIENLVKLIIKFCDEINIRELKFDENFSNQNFSIDYYIIYTNIQKNFYKLHLEKIRKILWQLLFITFYY